MNNTLKNSKYNMISTLKKGDTIYTILRHTSASGMSRNITFLVIRKNKPLYLDYDIEQVMDYKGAKNTSGIKIGGCGMDMGFHVVYGLSNILFKNGYALKHEWL